MLLAAAGVGAYFLAKAFNKPTANVGTKDAVTVVGETVADRFVERITDKTTIVVEAAKRKAAEAGLASPKTTLEIARARTDVEEPRETKFNEPTIYVREDDTLFRVGESDVRAMSPFERGLFARGAKVSTIAKVAEVLDPRTGLRVSGAVATGGLSLLAEGIYKFGQRLFNRG